MCFLNSESLLNFFLMYEVVNKLFWAKFLRDLLAWQGGTVEKNSVLSLIMIISYYGGCGLSIAWTWFVDEGQ